MFCHCGRAFFRRVATSQHEADLCFVLVGNAQNAIQETGNLQLNLEFFKSKHRCNQMHFQKISESWSESSKMPGGASAFMKKKNRAAFLHGEVMLISVWHHPC